jgi:hypothetical protein
VLNVESLRRQTESPSFGGKEKGAQTKHERGGKSNGVSEGGAREVGQEAATGTVAKAAAVLKAAAVAATVVSAGDGNASGSMGVSGMGGSSGRMTTMMSLER